MNQSLLEVSSLNSYYGDLQVLFEVSFFVSEGEIVSLLGRNGAGKSTCLKSLMGLVKQRRADRLSLHGKDLLGLSSRDIARSGLAYCPDDRGIYASLSVKENLLLAPKLFPAAKTLEEIYILFPRLKERQHLPGKKISGGEQQMLAIARLLMTGSKTLLLDEPTEGLAPLVVEELVTLLNQLKKEAYSIVVVEQNHRFARAVADRHYLFDRGRVTGTFLNSEFSHNENKVNMILGFA